MSPWTGFQRRTQRRAGVRALRRESAARGLIGPRSAFTLIELMIVIALLGIVAAVAISDAAPGTSSQLASAAELAAADLNYARSLAILNNSQYRLSFDLTQNSYVLKHTGANAALNTLPPSPFRNASDLATEQTVDLDDLPFANDGGVRLYAVRSATTTAAVTTLEFGPLGQTTASTPTEIWLTAGADAMTRYIPLRVDPASGLVTIGEMQGAAPATLSTGTGFGGWSMIQGS